MFVLHAAASFLVLMSGPTSFEAGAHIHATNKPEWFHCPSDDVACQQALNDLKQDLAQQKETLMSMRDEIVRIGIQNYTKKGLLDFSKPHVSLSANGEHVMRFKMPNRDRSDHLWITIFDDHLRITCSLNYIPDFDSSAGDFVDKKNRVLREPYGALLVPMNSALSEALRNKTSFTRKKKVLLDHTSVAVLHYWAYQGVGHTFSCHMTLPLEATHQTALKKMRKESKEAALQYLEQHARA